MKAAPITETPYYLIDEARLLKNLKKLQYVRDASGAKSLLAMKCFAVWGVFDLISKYMDGTTCSSLYESMLGREKFGKEVQTYSTAFSEEEIRETRKYSNKIIFNSISQLKTFGDEVSGLEAGLRINPGISFSDYDLADPARKYSRLGVKELDSVLKVLPLINGAMFHYNCENDNFGAFAYMLDIISHKYGDALSQLSWVSLGGGIYFTLDDYPLEKFSAKLKEFSERFGVQVYLEPGETVVTGCACLVTKVLDIVRNEIDIGIVDSSVDAHMPDLLIYDEYAEIDEEDEGGRRYMIAGKSCLAGDVFGTFDFKRPLKKGDIIRVADAAAYTMVKNNWFNGLKMPSIVLERLDGSYKIIKTFGYEDFKNNLS